MQDHWASFGIGIVTGLRSMTASAALSWAASLGQTRIRWIPSGSRTRRFAAAVVLAEMAGDKMPFAPDRLIPPSFAARLAIGAVGGAGLWPDRMRRRSAVPWPAWRGRLRAPCWAVLHGGRPHTLAPTGREG